MKLLLSSLSLLCLVTPLPAAIIGTNVPAAPLTAVRIATLPVAQQPAWNLYLQRSVQQMKADRAFLHGELKAVGAANLVTPPIGHSDSLFTTKHPETWYASPEARHLADIVVSFQTPAGGWSKNLNLTKHVRAAGEAFATDNNTQFPIPADNDLARDPKWHYVGTFDNGATIMELRFLASVVAANGTNGAAYRAAFLHGLDYVFNAQYPNGGWPQVWPLEGGYHDAITYNDDAMLHVLELLQAVAGGQDEYAFVPAPIRAQAAAAFQRGLNCLLASQIIVNGHRTVWCQQHDALTLQPASARNYEMPALCTGESGKIVLFLMLLPDPDSNTVAAVRGAVKWFQQTEIRDHAFKSTGGNGRLLVSAPGHSPIWARYYDLKSGQPIFGDRDKTIHDEVKDLSKERRNGYAWFDDTPKRVLEHFLHWSKEHP